MAKRNALITGATSGIGEATARLLAKSGFNLIICGRRKEKLDRLAAKLLEREVIFKADLEEVLGARPFADKNSLELQPVVGK